MTLWVLKGGRSGERDQLMIDNGIISVGWQDLPDLSDCRDLNAIKRLYREKYPDAGTRRVDNHSGQINAFLRKAKIGELVLIPYKTRSAIAVGKITGKYEYRTDLGGDIRHARKVKWLNTDIPRSSFDQDLLYSFGALMTFHKAERNDAEERVKKIATAKYKKGSPGETSERTGDFEMQDLTQRSRDMIADYIGKNFREHDLARLVDAVLQARGFFTKISAPGPDGGVDILVGSGIMGFDSPKICVQVKSSAQPVGTEIFRNLKGTMDSFGSEQGLLVSWGGFKSSVLREAKNSFFRVRLWDAGDLLDAIFSVYDDLPEEIQAQLPLNRVWALALGYDPV